MRVALLSCGPSVVQYEGGHDAVIGVNRIVTRYRCDYWCFGDTETFVNNQPLGKPTLVTDDATVFSLTHNCGADLSGFKRIGWETFAKPLPPDTQLCFSACAALLLVKYL